MDAETPTGTSDGEALSVDHLVALVRRLEQTIAELQVENARLKGQLEDRDGQHPTQRLEDEYSLEAEDKRDAAKRAGGQRRKKQKSSRRGRRTTEEKLAEADRHEDVFSEGDSPDDCTLHLSRVVRRIEHGQAVLVAYHVYRGPGGEVPTIPGTLGRSECGIEIYVALTFMVFIVRLSMDKVCQQLEFFWGLKLAKSQADALLNRQRTSRTVSAPISPTRESRCGSGANCWRAAHNCTCFARVSTMESARAGY